MTGIGLPIQNAIELVEYALEIGGRNAGTTIRDANDNLRSITMRAHINR